MGQLYSKLEELFLSEYTDLNEYKSKLAYQLHAFLFLELGIDKLLNADFTQFGFGDEKINQSLQNAFYFANNKDNLIDQSKPYDQSVFDLSIQQYKLRGYFELSDKKLPVNGIKSTEQKSNETEAVEKFVANTGKAVKFVANTGVKIAGFIAQ